MQSSDSKGERPRLRLRLHSEPNRHCDGDGRYTANAAGNLALHHSGALRYLIGHVLGGIENRRDRVGSLAGVEQGAGVRTWDLRVPQPNTFPAAIRCEEGT